jgi:CheY-like chemotaxis protein
VRALAGERERATPAIAMTAQGADFPREEALLAGFDVFLTKPIHPLVLGHYVKALYEESRTNERLQKFGRPRSLKTA